MAGLLAVLERAASQAETDPHPAYTEPGAHPRPGAWTGGRQARRYQVAEARASVTVSAPTPDVLRGCDRLAGHAYRSTGPQQPGATGWRVELFAVAPEALHGAPEVFVSAPLLDDRAARPVRYLVGAAQRSFYTDDGSTVIHVDLGRGLIRVFTARPALGRSWAPLLLRQAMTYQLRVGGAGFVHCAAVNVGGAGVLIAGPPGTGKTTALLAALRLAGADLIGDAPLLLDVRDDEPIGLPWPAPLTLGAGALASYPELRVRLFPDLHARPDRIGLDPEQADLLLAGGTRRDRIRPALLLLCHLALDRVSPNPGPALYPEDVRGLAEHTGLFLGAPDQTPTGGNTGGDTDRTTAGPPVGLTDWLTDPAPEPPEPARPGQRPGTDTARIAHALAALPCHWLAVTADPVDITRQINALLPDSGRRR